MADWVVAEIANDIGCAELTVPNDTVGAVLVLPNDNAGWAAVVVPKLDG